MSDEQRTVAHRTDLNDLKNALLIAGRDGIRLVLPVVLLMCLLVGGVGLLVSSAIELKTMPAIPLPRETYFVDKETLHEIEANAKTHTAEIAKPVTVPVHRVAPKKSRRAYVAARQRHAYRNSYDENMYPADNPTGGRVVHNDWYNTEYQWNRKPSHQKTY